MESGKSVDRDKIMFPIIYNRRNVDIDKIMKEEYLHLQTLMKKLIMARPVIAYRNKSKSLCYFSFEFIIFSVLFRLLSLYPNNYKKHYTKNKTVLVKLFKSMMTENHFIFNITTMKIKINFESLGQN